MSALAKKILELDQKYPGDVDASMELPAEMWAGLVALAKADPESDLIDALKAYLSAGHKEARRAASVVAKAAIEKARDTRGGQPRIRGPRAQLRTSTHPEQASGKGDGR